MQIFCVCIVDSDKFASVFVWWAAGQILTCGSKVNLKSADWDSTV